MTKTATSTDCSDTRTVAIVEAIRAGKWRESVEHLRGKYSEVLTATGDPHQAREAVSDLKKRLPGILWSGKFDRRCNDGLLAHSGLLCADLDDLGDRIAKVRHQLVTDPHVFALFTSPTGTGLKVVFRVPAVAASHTASFNTVAALVGELCGVDVDTACKDLARLCFVSFDPNVFWNRDAVELVPLATPSRAKITALTMTIADEEPRIRAALNFIPAAPRGTWRDIGFALKSHFGEAGWPIFDEWSQLAPDCYNANENRKQWESFKLAGGIKIGTLYHRAKKHGWKPDTVSQKNGPAAASTAIPTTATAETAANELTIAELLVSLVADVPLFRDDERTAYAEVPKPNGPEVLRVRSGRFNEWLAAEYHRNYHGVAKRSVIDDARAVISGEAELGGVVLPVFIRVGADKGCIVLDLCDVHRRSVIISPGGWTVANQPPVKFLRPTKALPLPDPKMGGDFSALWTILNVRERDRVLCAGWLLSALQPFGPFFVANFVGEQGTGKSCACRVLRNIVDPSSIPLRRGTTEERSLWVAAANNRVLAFENLSVLPAWLSDALCALATGGGYSSRQLYTDGDEATFSAQRPVLLNGIADVVGRPDLAERTLRVELEPIPKTKRRTETELNAAFTSIAPAVLGALLDAAAYGLSRLKTLQFDELPRMADAALWIEACLPKLGFKEGDFLSALDRHERETADSAIDGSAVARAVVVLMNSEKKWEGPAGVLLPLLAQKIPDAEQRRYEWPGNPRALSGALRRMAPALRRVGIQIQEPRPGDKKRQWKLSKAEVPDLPPEPPEPPSGLPALVVSLGGSHAMTAPPPARPPEAGTTLDEALGGVGGMGGNSQTPAPNEILV